MPVLHVLLQVAHGVTSDQIRGIFSPYGEIVDLNVMQPKKDGAMGKAPSVVGTAVCLVQRMDVDV